MTNETPDYFDDKQNVEEYVKMAEGYDGRELIEILRSYLPDGATVLELGMGPGVDLELLSQHFQVTGSDRSNAFIERYREQNPQADLLRLDAVTMETDRRFDAVYSNKVLHHLSRDDLKKSLRAQARVLNDGGIVLHSLWYGDRDEDIHGIHFAYYTEGTFTAMLGDEFEVLLAMQYEEMDEADSIYFVLRKTESDDVN